MAVYRLSVKAAADLEEIYEYTILNFGLIKAQAYLHSLAERLNALANHPAQGRRAAQLAPALRRFEHRSHIIFYVEEEPGVLIVRVLHQSMDVPRHL